MADRRNRGPRGKRGQGRPPHVPAWQRESTFFGELRGLEAYMLLSVPTADEFGLNEAVDRWAQLDPEVKDYIKTRMTFNVLAGLDEVRRRLDRAVDHMGSVRTGTRLTVEELKRRAAPRRRYREDEDDFGDDADLDDDFDDEDDFGDEEEDPASFDPQTVEDFGAPLAADGDTFSPTNGAGDATVLDYDPWEGMEDPAGGGGDGLTAEAAFAEDEDDLDEEPPPAPKRKRTPPRPRKRKQSAKSKSKSKSAMAGKAKMVTPTVLDEDGHPLSQGPAADA